MTMNCVEAQTAIEEALRTATSLDAAIEHHLAWCDDCRHSYEDLALAHALQGQTVPPPRAGFVDDVIAAAIRSGVRTRPTFGPIHAVAASVAIIGIVLGVLFGARLDQPNKALPYVTLNTNEGRTVRVVIDSSSDRQQATVTIELADNLELAGFPDQRRIEWQTDLLAGKNLLALPLTLTAEADSHFNVALAYGSTRKYIRVLVHPAPPKREPAPINV
jgi:hypothetical protein